jgi:hypothetical protein
MALLEADPGKLRPPKTQGPATDRVPDDRASGTPDALREDLVRLLGPQKVLHSLSDLVKYASDASPCGSSGWTVRLPSSASASRTRVSLRRVPGL